MFQTYVEPDSALVVAVEKVGAGTVSLAVIDHLGPVPFLQGTTVSKEIYSKLDQELVMPLLATSIETDLLSVSFLWGRC